MAKKSLLEWRRVRHIDGDHDVGDTSVEEYFGARNLYVDHAAVLLLMSSEYLCRVVCSRVRHIPQRRKRALAGTNINVKHGHRQELPSRASVVMNRCIIDGRTGESPVIEDPHGIRIEIEVKTIQCF